VGESDDVFRVQLGLAAAGLNQQAVREATQAALNVWQNAGSRLKFQLLEGFSGVNELNDATSMWPVFVTSRDAFYRYAGFNEWNYALAVPVYSEGVLKACDILLNAVDFSWSTQAPSFEIPEALRPMDLQSVLMHEIGHCLNLPHLSGWVPKDEEGGERFSPGAMYPSLSKGEQRRTLNVHDISTLRAYYPLRGPGARCSLASDCNNMPCIRQQVHSSEQGYCAPTCVVGVGDVCPIPMRCSAQGTQGNCLLPTLPETPVGEACPSPRCEYFQGSNCLVNGSHGYPWPGGYCSQSCGTSGGTCPPGSVCDSDVNTCVKTCTMRGNDCRKDYVCYPDELGNNLFSDDKGTCWANCSFTGCNAGDVCRPWDNRCMLAQNINARIGDRCEKNEECNTGHECWQPPLLSQKLCTARCRPGEPPCPGGSACVSLKVGGKEELLCLSRCETREKCEGMQCALVDMGKVCLPPCKVLADCPVGSTRCEQGQCLTPEREGPRALEGEENQLQGIESDAKPPPSKKASSGCACRVVGETPGGSGGGGGWLLLALLMGFNFRRKGMV